jgi:NTP pyrophosphatase (non-canonical NTP hydrolase)
MSESLFEKAYHAHDVAVKAKGQRLADLEAENKDLVDAVVEENKKVRELEAENEKLRDELTQIHEANSILSVANNQDYHQLKKLRKAVKETTKHVLELREMTIEDRMIEEIGEVLQAIGKGKRFGWNGHHPDRPYQTNLDELNNEITDLMDAFYELKESLR